MTHLTLLPTHVDALFIREEQTTVGTMADFSNLPFTDPVSGHDVNPNLAYLSETILSEPFQDKNLRLKPGIHLHWSLPDALTKSIGFPIVKKQPFLQTFPQAESLWSELLSKNWIKLIHGNLASVMPRERRTGVLATAFQPSATVIEAYLSKSRGADFPAVPNRWLITRSRNGAVEKQWIVESDYLYPAGKGFNSGGITFPVPRQEGQSQPFRFMGRKMPFDVWLAHSNNQDRYLEDETGHYLTAIGYGEPTFAAFYPNCHGIFGLHDDDYAQSYPANLQYDILGWYDKGENDYLSVFLKDFENKYTGQSENLVAAQWQAVEKALHWTANKVEQVSVPGPLVCTAKISFLSEWIPAETITSEGPPPKSQTHITLGNTGTEALSAYLAKELGINHKSWVEDQLESLLLSAQLEHRNLDVGPKFFEARHEKGFDATRGGLTWFIKSIATQVEQNAQQEAEEKVPLSIPAAIADQLNQLNTLQKKYDHAQEKMATRRRQLYSDWYKYMLCAYPPDGDQHQYPDIDLVKFFIEEKGLTSLEKEQNRTGHLLLQRNEAGDPIQAMAVDQNPESLASQLAGNMLGLLNSIQSFNQLAGTKKQQQQLVLKSKEANRYWQPKEPVVLVTGNQVQATNRHGQDGRLHPKGLLEGILLDIPNSSLSGTELIKSQFETIRSTISTYQADQTIGFNSWSGNPWHPLLLEWEVEIFPKKRGLNHSNQLDNYDQNYIIDNYTLPENQPDLEDMPSENSVVRSAQVYRGRSILTPQASLQMSDKLESFLNRMLKQEGLQAFYQAQQTPTEHQNDTWVNDNFPSFLNWIQSNHQEWSALPSDFDEADASSIETWVGLNTSGLIQWFLAHNFIIQQFRQSHPQAKLDNDLSPLIEWMQPLSNLKQVFFTTNTINGPDQATYLENHADAFLNWFKTLVSDFSRYYWDRQVDSDAQGDAYLKANLEDLIHWYQAQLRKGYQLRLLISIHRWMDGLHVLSQTLGGFNDALLMHKQTLQLPVADPLGFSVYQAFAEKVNQAIGSFRDSAPQPMNDFSPIRNGLMKIKHLNLIDTFGQSRELVKNGAFLFGPAIRTSEPLNGPSNKLFASLPPRLSQAARLKFRWLSSTNEDVEMLDHPSTSPICGWLLPNHLDQSLMVYDQDGKVLGALSSNPDQIWQPAPGNAFPVLAEGIPNSSLKQVVQHIIELQGQSLLDGRDIQDSYLWNFMTTLDNAVEHIDPETFGRHQDLAILMGRPIAIARAKLSIEVKGHAAIHQGWNAFRQDLKHQERITDGFEKVKFPIRLGEYQQLNDGLIGYWQEQEEGFRDNLFFAPQSASTNDPNIKSHADHPMQVLQAIADDDQLFTFLLDPRGKIHATSGILPVKAIDIPPEQYVHTLSRLEVTFLTAPVISDQRGVRISLPKEEGYSWSWLERTKAGQWKEIPNRETITYSVFQKAYDQSNARLVWNQLLSEEMLWLQPFQGRTDLAIVVPKEQRKTPKLPNDALNEQIEQILDYYGEGIKVYDDRASFPGKQMIKEGWLKLSNVEKE